MQGFEICRRYNLKTDPLPEQDIQQMELLLWKWNRAWEKKFDELREVNGEEPFNVNGDEYSGDLQDWERFAEENYSDQLPQYPSMVCLAVLLLPLMC